MALKRSFLLAYILTHIACSFVGAESENELACNAFVDAFDRLECTEDNFFTDCRQTREDPCMTPQFFECLEAAYRCDAGELVEDDVGACEPFRFCDVNR